MSGEQFDVPTSLSLDIWSNSRRDVEKGFFFLKVGLTFNLVDVEQSG